MKRIFSLILAFVVVQFVFAQISVKELVVTNVSDDSENPASGSLRWACNQATATTPVKITFKISGSGNKVIELTNRINITGAVTIDASSSADSIIIDGSNCSSSYCFYLTNDESSADFSLKGVSIKNISTCVGTYIYTSYDNTVKATIESCDLYGVIYASGGTVNLKKCNVYSRVVIPVAYSVVNVSDCVFKNEGAYIDNNGNASLVCSRNLFLRNSFGSNNPISYYDYKSVCPTPVIDTAYVSGGKLHVEGSVALKEVASLEFFSSYRKYSKSSSLNYYECTKYLGAAKTKSDGTFSCDITYPETGLMLKQHFVLGTTATYASNYTSPLSFYDVALPYWVVNTTASSSGSNSPCGTMGWACYNAVYPDTIVFNFSGKGTKVIEGGPYESSYASVDGSTYSDTIVVHGLKCVNANKIVSEGAYYGFYVWGGNLTNCVARNNDVGIRGRSAVIDNCLVENNSTGGVFSDGDIYNLNNSIVENNGVGVSGNIKSVKNCSVINNKDGGIQGYTDTIAYCWISGNGKYGISGTISRELKGNIIGLTQDQKKAMPNKGIGVSFDGSCNIIDNVIAGNDSIGINQLRPLGNVLKGNFVGTNKYLDVDPALGNGSYGLYNYVKSGNYISDCYFMNNGKTGAYVYLFDTIRNCSFSYNGESGLLKYEGGAVFENCDFSGNKGCGFRSESTRYTIKFIDCEFSNNGKYGIDDNGEYLTITNTIFDGNSQSAVYLNNGSKDVWGNKDFGTNLLSNNQFLNTTKKNAAAKAIEFSDSVSIYKPEILSLERVGNNIVMTGKSAVPNVANVEMFVSNGKETAIEFVDSVKTDKTGAFKLTIPISKFSKYKGELCVTTTVTYSSNTSDLSDVYCCPDCLCSSDTIFTNDTIAVNEKFLGKSYAIGRYNGIIENLKSADGCDSVVSHNLLVKPNSSLHAYYVKVDGKGDGSSWDKAMNGKNFAFSLPLVADGTKFYIAEGKYQPIYDNKGEVPTDITDKEFFTTKCVSIYGGFPSTAKGTDLTRDPAKYLTTFDGDLAQNNASEYDYDEFSYGSFRKDDVRYILRIQPVTSGPVEISGIVFENSRQNSSAGSASLHINGSSTDKVSCNINKCTFSRGTAGLGLYSCSDSKVSECLFLNNETGGSFSDAAQKSTVRVEKNTFVNIESWHFNSTCKKAIIVNNTFAGVPKVSNSINADTAYVMNNTFNGEIWSTSTSLLNLVGNIINGDVAYMGTNVKSSHNVYLDVNKDSLFIDKSDVLATAEELDALLADKPIYDDHTLVIPLQDDKLTSGKSIRFPLSETMVTEDQRGVARLDSTCMGAYEINCANDTTLVRDTIYVGGKFMDVTYTQVGVHDSIFENLKSQFGCDSVVMHILLVKPDPTVKEYYVKTKREGKGDGSSWENAMNGEDFAAVLPLAPDGVTFYVAEGEYKPIFDVNGDKNSVSSELIFVVNSNVNIQGGYYEYDNAQMKNDPLYHKTIFSGDINGDDSTIVFQNDYIDSDECMHYDTLFFYDNITDNSNLFMIRNNSNLNLSDVNITSGQKETNPITFQVLEGSSLELNRSTISNSKNVINADKSSVVNIISCDFKTCQGCNNILGNLKISNSIFEYCYGSSVYGFIHVISSTSVKIENSLFSKCSGGKNGLINIEYSIAELNNNTFFYSDFGQKGFYAYSLYAQGSKLYLNNNTFLSPMPSHTLCLKSESSKLYLVGNIFGMCGNDEKYTMSALRSSTEDCSDYIMKSIHNLYVYGNSDKQPFSDACYATEEDISCDTKSLSSLVEGYDDGCRFYPILRTDEEGIPTFTLKSDKLPDGTSIRFPLTATTVTEDQRGVARLDSTCMGAYEINCGDDTLKVNDTIVVGGEFLGVTYDAIGRYDSIFETKTSPDGCVNTMMYTLYVKPDPSVLAYYVKTKSEGKGDGSSWENAMNGDDFAACLPLAPDGATFYVAEGRYLPSQKEDGTYGYEINSKVSIVGGFPAQNSARDSSDPKKYKTIFTVDPSADDKYISTLSDSIADPSHDDLQCEFLFLSNNSAIVRFEGCEIANVPNSKGSGAIPIMANNVELEKCSFYCTGSFHYNDSNTPTKLIASECYFKNRSSVSNPSAIFCHDSISINKSTFEDMYNGSEGYFTRSSYVRICNSTLTNQISSVSYHFARAKEMHLYNNTFINFRDKISGSTAFINNVPENSEIIGNIFVNCKYDKLFNISSGVVKNNLCENMIGSEEDIEIENFADVLIDGYLSTQSDFVTLRDNGGFAPTAALLTDTLPDGTSIRFPLSETTVTEDQRGVARLDSTCMGAYEINCGPDTLKINDTIVVGGEFLGVTYDAIGRYDSIFETKTSPDGCVNTMMYTLYVKPDPSVLAYYVKTKSEGKGDGSSWENAMNGDDFAACLPLAPENVTFYIAEGIYKPIYSQGLVTPNYPSSSTYEIQSSMNIRGGYPADAKTGAVSDPSKYATIFDGDKLDDDKIVESVGEDGFMDIEFSNIEDNVVEMFYISTSKVAYLNFDGVQFRNADEALYFNSLNATDLTFANSTFTHNHGTVLNIRSNDNLVTKITNTSFLKNSGNNNRGYSCVYQTGKALIMDSVEFSYNKDIIKIESRNIENVKLNHISATHNEGDYQFLYTIGKNFELSNSKFSSNMGTIELAENSLIENSEIEYHNGIIEKVYQGNTHIENTKFSNCQNLNKVFFKINSVDSYVEINNSTYEKTKADVLLYIDADSIDIRHSTINDNNLSGNLLFVEKGNYTNLEYCNINNNTISGDIHTNEIQPSIFETINCLTKLNGNSIWNNKCDSYFFYLPSRSNPVIITNNTIVSNEASNISYSAGVNIYYYDNTIVGNVVSNYLIQLCPGNLYLSGNIILGNQTLNNSTEAIETYNYNSGRVIEYRNNILPSYEDRLSPGSTNYGNEYILEDNIFSIFDNTNVPDNLKDIPNNNKAILTALFKGTYDSETNLFTPVLDKSYFTPVVALRDDKLADGTSIRFPLSETTVTEDQTGAARLDSTCMGAVEFLCKTIESDLKDEIVVGESYSFGDDVIAPTKPGIVYANDTLKNAQNCDSIIHLTLLVRPVPSENGYFVKKNGTGDGHDWANAMSPEDFAAYLPVAYDGDTFHVAEGVYEPIDEIPGVGKGYMINSSVVLVGGYPDTAKSLGVQSQPDLYETVLSASGRKKDYFYSYVECNSSPYGGTQDNMPTLLYSGEKVDLTVWGMTLSGASSCDQAAIQLDAEGSSLNLERCHISKNAATAVKAASGSKVTVNECYFNENFTNRAGVFDLEDAELKVTHSTFDHNRVKGSYCEESDEDSVAGVAYLKDTKATFENSTFVYNNASKGGIFYLDGADLSLTNVTITGNGNFTETPTRGSVIYAAGKTSDVKLFGNMIVGNGDSIFTGGSLSVSLSNYNIYSQNPSWTKGPKDMLMADNEMISTLDGSPNDYYPKNYFEPTLRLVEGYTPVVAVLTSEFSGGEVLSILREDQKVKDDQRGFLRKDTCCVGAFEFPTLTDYYVKVLATGDGTGRDWNNAMSDSTFSTYFPIVPNNATFHIAAGTYHPMQDGYGHFSQKPSCSYSTTRSVNVIGGYPASAQIGDESDPSRYHTILSADLKEDNALTLYPHDDMSYVSISLDNISDNTYYVMSITPYTSGESKIYGIVFKGSRSIPKASSSAFTFFQRTGEKNSLVLDHCSFKESYAGVSVNASSVRVNECRFDTIVAYAFSSMPYSPSTLVVTKSTFELVSSAINLNDEIDAEISNNTVIDANSSFSFYNNGYRENPLRVKFYNNTLSSGSTISTTSTTVEGKVELEAKGNILNVAKSNVRPFTDAPLKITSDYNIFTSSPDGDGTIWAMGEHDMIVKPSDLDGVLDGEYSDGSGKFTAKLTENGGFCENIRLLNVILPDDKSVKMIPTGTTPVTDDQRYVERDEVYCAGSYEVDCSFSNGDLKLVPSNTEFCRDDTVLVTLSGLTELEANTYKYHWYADNDSVRVVSADSNAVKFHLYSHQSDPQLSLTVTNACGNDTTMFTTVHVNGTGAVPFSGIEESDIICKNSSDKIELTTSVEGASFEGECVVDGHFFDPSLAAGDSTRIRCAVADGSCQSFDDKMIPIISSESFVLQVELEKVDMTCSYQTGSATVLISSESDAKYDAYFDNEKLGTYSANDTIELFSMKKGSHALYVEAQADVCPASDTMRFHVTGPGSLSLRLESEGAGCGSSVTAYVSGETGLYQYTWKDESGEVLPNTSEILSGIGAGTYTCEVKAEGCETIVSERATIATVEDKGTLSVTFEKTDETCVDGNNGTVTVKLKASNPNEKVTVVLTSGKDEYKKTGSQRAGSVVFENLPPTQYSMTAYFGSEDCVSAPTDVKETVEIGKKTTKLAITSLSAVNNTCLSPLNGYVLSTVNGWDNGYTALLNDRAVTPVSVDGEVASFKIETLAAGEYTFYVEDNCKSHSDKKDVKIASIEPYKLEMVKYTDSLECARYMTGYVKFDHSGGYKEQSSFYIIGKTGYSSLNPDEMVMVGDNYFANLKKDSYRLYYKSDLEECLDSDSLVFEVKGPDTLAADYIITCQDDESVVKVSATGESGSFKYRWNGGEYTEYTENPVLPVPSLSYGTEYICEVSDVKGCDVVPLSIKFVDPAELKALKMNYTLDPQSCVGVPNAKIEASAKQKQDKYEVTFVLTDVDEDTIVDKISVSEIDKTISFSGLAVGNYQLKLRYGGEDCEIGGPTILSDTIKVEPLKPLEGSLVGTKALTCINEPNASAEIKLTQGWSQHHSARLYTKIRKRWTAYREKNAVKSSEGQSAVYLLDELPQGSYKFTVEDQCGKDSISFTFEIAPLEPYAIDLVDKTKFLDCYTDDTAHIEVSVSGGYLSDNEFYLAGTDTQSVAKAQNFKYTGLTAGMYHFYYGTTQSGCSDSVSFDVKIETDSILIDLAASGEMCYDAKLLATVSGGKTPYTLVWGNENADSLRIDASQPFMLENTGVADYYATVVDNIGCRARSESVHATLVGDMSKDSELRIDSISLNSLQCLFPSENGDIKVFVVGNTYRSNLSVILRQEGQVLKETVSSAEVDTILFDGLPFDQNYQLSVSFQGAEECASGNDNLNRTIELTKPEPFSVDFTATDVLCVNSHDAEIGTRIHSGAAVYHYEWHKLVEDAEDETVSHDVYTSDTLRDLRKDERYYCKVVDQNFCEVMSDTFTIGYSKADTMEIDTFEYDERQRCKGVDNAHMYISFNKVAPWVDAKFELSVIGGDALEKQDQDASNDHIHINELGPNKYHLVAGYGVEGCPTLLDTSVEIFEMVGDLKVAPSPDSTHDALCVSTKDGKIYFHLDGVAKKQVVELYDEENKLVKKIQQDSLSVERGFYTASGLLAGDYKVKVTNDCDTKDSASYTLKGYKNYDLKLDEEKSHLDLRCPYSEDGVIAFSLEGYESKYTLNFMTYDSSIIENFKDSVIYSDCVMIDSVRRKDTVYTMYNRDESSVSVHSSVAPKMEKNTTEEAVSYNYYLSVDSVLGEIDTFAVKKELLPGVGANYKYTVYEKGGIVKWELSNISHVDTIAPASEEDETLYRFHTMVDSLVAVRDTDNMKMTWNYVMDPNNDSLFLYEYYEIPTICSDTVRVSAGTIVEYHPVLNELDGNDATLKDGVYYFTDFKKGDYYLKAKTTLENCPDADTMNVVISAPRNVVLTKDILPVSCRSKNDGSVSLKPHREGELTPELYLSRDSVLYQTNYKVNYLYKRTSTKHDQNGDNYTSYDYEHVIYKGDTVMGNINDLSNRSTYLVKKHDGSNVTISTVTIDEEVDPATLFGGDIVSIEWKRMKESGDWENINNQIIWPASADSLEETYFNANGDTIKDLVWSASHLETFWDDNMGVYQEVGVQTVANMSPAKYAVLVTDAAACEYEFSFEVKEPENALKIESVEYDSELALCKPEERHIFVRASGGWGNYKYSFSAEADTSKGYVVSAYNGGEANSYDASTVTGWGRSKCLLDGIYTVSVLDDKGCVVSYEDPIEVKSHVQVTADTSATLCPGVVSAPISFKVSNTNNYNGTYTIKEYLSACGTAVTSCIDDSLPVQLEHANVNDLALTVGPGRHGYLVYEDDNNACGGYVEVIVLDTIRPMDISKKSIDSAKCYGSSNGAISLYLKGGTSPYELTYDKFWFDEEENQMKSSQESRSYDKSTMEMEINEITKNDNTVVFDTTYFFAIEGLSAAKYCFTMVDANGCVRSLGIDGSVDTLTVRQPDSLHVDVSASGSCPDTTGLVTKYISVFGQNMKGGIPPYRYFAAKKGANPESNDEGFFDLDVRTNDVVTFTMEDANQCRYDKEITINPQRIPVERYDFILSTWSKYNDVVALIDLCAPEVAFDSVSYTVNDENVEFLDKRMYIYDVYAPENKELLEELSKVDTKTEVSDMFFKNHFKLCVDSSLAKHIQFIRRNNLVTYKWRDDKKENEATYAARLNDSMWVQDNIKMRAFFKGCAYDVERNGCFIIATDEYKDKIYNGGLSGESDVLDLQVTPNPFDRNTNGECYVRVTVASTKAKGNIFLYTLEGKKEAINTSFSASQGAQDGWTQLDGSLYNRPGQSVYQKTFSYSASEFQEGAEVVVVLVKTANDAKSTYLILK